MTAKVWNGLCVVAAGAALLVASRMTIDDGQAPPRLSRAGAAYAPGARFEHGPGSLTSRRLRNPHAYIPPQCYTKTRDERDAVHNPCFTCHLRSRAPNYVNDGDLQLEYAFAGPARDNPWTNLFTDRRQAIASIPDAEILAYVRQSNYVSEAGELVLAERLKHLPPTWDEDGDGRFRGYVPDAYFAFDDEGFDRDPRGHATGWRAFGYYPLPGTFWPTNGSAGDVLIRLPQAFRQDQTGREDLTAYKINLAVVEALITRRDVVIDPIAEQRYTVDLDQDGKIDRAERVAYASASMRYVGGAKALQTQGRVHAVKGLFPEGTEFLHSVRYLDVEGADVTMAERMKELRYARKTGWLGRLALEERAAAEIKEKYDFPDRLRTVVGSFETGVNNAQGWQYQGFIEDRSGNLRPQTFEETVFCVGCHGGVGATVDGIFSFPRKLSATGPRHGWFHWSRHGLSGIAEPQRADGRYEYTLYLEENRAGDEFRENREVMARFFAGDALRPDMVEALHGDIGILLLPSPDRALRLDKAYREVVLEQSYHLGRDAVLSPMQQVYETVQKNATTGIAGAVLPRWAPPRIVPLSD